MKKTKTSKLICLFLTVLTVISILPTAVFAACSHSYSKVYSYQNANMHSYETVCSKCGDTKIGTGYSGWEDHTFNTSGKCTKCGYSKVCGHTNTTRKYNNLSSTQHEYYTHCNGCGIDYMFTTVNHSYSGGTWTSYSSTQHKKTSTCACGATKTEYANHSFSGNKCTVCGYTKDTTCSHSSTTKSYSSKSETQHTVTTKCSSCGTVTGTTTESHSFSGNSCTKCGYTKTATVTASVTLSASSSSGTLGSAGGEISAEGAPASYTVKATASGCSVTKITYTQNGRTYTVSGSSVTITANSDSDFTTTTFTAYTSVSGVTATFTVNHKVVKHTTSQVMWETSNTAVIRSITGNGMNKSLSYSMTIPTSYNGQSNLSADQVATIQSLIGASDGKTYTVKYTRTITVYTPAQYSSTGSRVNLGTFDGNDSSQIDDCLSRWGWSSTTAEAIRQAASSSLTFTTGIATNCTAKWINTDTNQQLYSTSFGTGTVSASSSKTVSVSYSDYSGSGNYVFEKLAYSGDSTGTSTNQSFSMTYTATSKPLTVTFYCHPSTSSTTTDDDDLGDITVYVRDRDTNELLSGATVSGAGMKGTTNTSGAVIFKGLSYGTHSFSVTKPGYTSNSGSATISSSVPSKSITIYLSKIVYDDDEDDEDYDYGDITIYVRDSETNAVISSASVYGRGTTKYTSTSGYVTFYDVPYGSYSFSASRSGYESNSTYVTTSSSYPNRTATIYLTPEEEYYDDEDETGDITVYVRDADTEELIEGAAVSGCGLSKTTSEYGYTVFYDLSFGTYPITASMDGYESESVSVTLSSTSGKTATIYLTPKEKPTKGSITVYVRDNSTNNLIYNASVVKDGTTYSTYSTGSITFTNLEFGTYSFKVSKTDYETRTTSVTISADEPDKTVTIYLYHIDYSATSGQITLYVKDAVTKEPIINAEVYGLEQSRYTSYGGSVNYYDVEFGIHYFTAYADGYYYDATYVSVYQSSSHGEATIYLYPEEDYEPITFNVRDSSTSDLIPYATIEIEGQTLTTDEHGAAMYYPTRDGSFTATASKQGYETSEDVFQYYGSAILVRLYIGKIKTGSATVYVRDKTTDELISGARVIGFGTSDTTGTSGCVAFSGFSFGTYSVSAEKDGYIGNAITVSVTEDNPQVTTTVYLERIPTKGSVKIIVADKDTKEPISNANVFFKASTSTAPNGEITFTDLKFMSYTVIVNASGYSSASTSVSISSDEPNKEITVYLTKKPTTGSILLYVFDYDTHEVIDGARIMYKGVDYALDENGSRLFSDLAFDNHVFMCSAPGYERYGYMDFLNETRLNTTGTIYLHKIKSDVSITANDVNGTVYRGSTIMVAATVHGDSEKDFTPSNPLTVTMKAKQNGSTVFSTQTKSVICPKGESNLVWFAVTVPKTGYTSSNDVTFTFEVTPPSGVTETSTDNNIASKTVTPTALPTRSTPKPSFELTKPKDFKGNVYKSNTTNNRTFTVWEWDGKFVKKTYSPTVTVSATLTPDSTAVWKTQNKTTKLWTTRSGYGLNTSVSLSCTGISSDMLSGNAKINAYYPEFNYSTSASKSNMLLRTSENTTGYTASFTFDADSDNLNNAKMHKTPVWFPDGEYSIKYEVYDLWTPAGEITGTTYAVVNIEGSMYDDYYTNHN